MEHITEPLWAVFLIVITACGCIAAVTLLSGFIFFIANWIDTASRNPPTCPCEQVEEPEDECVY